MKYKQIGKFSPELGTQFQQIGQVLTDVCQLLREDCQLLRQFGLVAVQKSTDLVHLKILQKSISTYLHLQNSALIQSRMSRAKPYDILYFDVPKISKTKCYVLV